MRTTEVHTATRIRGRVGAAGTPRPAARRSALLLGGLLLAIGPILAASGPVDAQTVGAVTDYDAYPAPLPDECPDGRAALVDVLFTNGRGAVTADLRQLDVTNGDTVTMSWAAFDDGCTTDAGDPAISVSLAVYQAPSGTFDPNVDQVLLPGWVTCGADGEPCNRVDGRYQLSVTIPGTDVSCSFQLEAVLGRPLAVVGPNGSYYSTVIRGDDRPNTLVDAQNFETSNCVPVPTTPVPTTPVPTTTTAVAVEAAGATIPTVDTVAPPTNGAAAAVQAAAAQLPVTGRSAAVEVWTGLALTVAGAGLVLLGALAARRIEAQRAG